MTQEFITTVGRLVWGNPARSNTKKDQNTKQPVLKDGKPVEQWVFGVAFPKAEFNQYIMPYLQHEAMQFYPNGVPNGFSWKFKDGDGVDRQGKPYRDREGYAGHYVLTISTEAFAPPIFKNEGGRYRQIEAHEIKTGDFIVVSLSVKANAPTNPSHTPGLYINPKGIELVGYGQEIVSSGSDPDEMFGGRTYQLPPGASPTPVATVGGAMPPYATAPQMPQTAPMPAPAQFNPQPQQYAPQPAPMPAPAHDFVQNAGQLQYQPAPMAAAPVMQQPFHAPQQAAHAPQTAPVSPQYPMPPMVGIPAGR